MSRGALRLIVALASVVCLGALGASATHAETGARYIVQLTDPPIASYRGGTAGLEATNPRSRGAVKLDPNSAASKAYLNYLNGRQAGVLAAAAQAIGRPLTVGFSYRWAYNGFAAVMTDAEAQRISSLPGVEDVQRDYQRELQSDVGPAWIGAPSVWDGSQSGGTPSKGEGVVVGVIDTGVNHDHPSFADKGGDGFDHRNPRGRFYGLCEPVTGLPFCNDKLIGVWDFTGTTPLDDNQHGSHTASTAVGNVLDATVNAPTISITSRLSGVAPHANLITYKACIAVGCLGASLTAAIDQATMDTVDVINYSIGGGPTDPWNDSDSEAFLGARDAGIFVSASAGNDGPRPETVGSPANAPWLLSVGASTHNRSFVNALTDLTGGGTSPGTLNGRSFTSAYGPAPIVDAAAFGDRLCGAPFAPGTFSGQIVVCERGINPRVEKGRNVRLGGAGGMVLINSAADGESEIADAHELPAVHISFTEGRQLLDWLAAGSGHSGRIAGTTADVADANGDVMAGFSSRGANKPVPGVLKPDITAPGVDVLAAVHTTNPASPPEYGVLSGTSMSSPHMTGSAALVRALHPQWTPAEVQSALMTTAKTTGVRKDDGVKPADAFDMGAGRVDLTRAARAGLVLDEQATDFAAANPADGGDPTSLNLASLGDGDCNVTCTWTRSVRNTLGSAVTWSVRTSAPKGMELTVEPRRFTVAAGATQELTITADVRRLPVLKWVFGDVRLTAGGGAAPDAHLPVALFTALALPVEIESGSTTGTRTVSVTSKVAITDLQTAAYGLTKGNVTERMLEQDPTPTEGPYDVSAGTFFVLVDVPAGAKFLASEIVETTALDLDLFVGRDTNGNGAPDEAEEVCRSASEAALESCRLSSPEGGAYWVLVENWLGGLSNVKLVTSVVPGTSAGNLTVTGPKSVPANTPFDVTLSWNEPSLAAGDTWFALVELGSDRRNRAKAKALFVKLTRN
jgi:subtilisin family serine protease